MIEQISGSKTAYQIFLHLFHYGESYASAVVKTFGLSLGQVQRQFDRFEKSGLLVSKLSGKTRLYSFNPKSPFTKPFKEMVRIEYENIPLSERSQIFAERNRPRRPGKPVIRS